MKCFVVLSLLGSCLAAPGVVVKPYINSGSASGPLTAAFGDLVSTGRGLRPLSLEGFSEDVNQDGFVDPLAQAVVPVVHHVAPILHHTYALPVVKPVEVKTVAAPALTYTHGFGWPYTHGYGLGWPYGLPLLPAAPAQAEEAAAPVVEAAERKKREADPEAEAEADPQFFYGHGFGYGLPYVHHAVAAPAAEVKTVEVPALTYTHHVPVVSHVPAVAYQQYAVHTPFTTVQKHVTTHTTHHVINHAPVIGAVAAAVPAAPAAVAVTAA